MCLLHVTLLLRVVGELLINSLHCELITLIYQRLHALDDAKLKMLLGCHLLDIGSACDISNVYRVGRKKGTFTGIKTSWYSRI